MRFLISATASSEENSNRLPINTFPDEPPFTVEEVLDVDYCLTKVANNYTSLARCLGKFSR